ncbi:MAG: ubiquinol-cytochrome c reductase iron-sulfur subunit [Solirubrobacteraceae bacterium]|nr:ubiquinol-cytochrome c reductase iron-sulfur subunit [Solirubrobacteraceae bacterium]
MAERKTAKSKYTADRQIPGAFEGETVTRRRFMTGTVHTAGAVATAAIVLPAAGFALGPVFEEKEQPWQPVGKATDFVPDTYLPRTITIEPRIGDVGKSTVFVRRFNPDVDTEPRDQYNEFIAISSACMHLGCPINFVAAAQRFICPCHGGVYDFVGKVAGGPPVRPLDRFYTRVENGTVQIGRRFSVNSELERFSPRDPGEPLDGVGQYMYPSRPSMRKLPGT